MAEIGKYNRLRIVKGVDFGLYLDGGELGEVLLPRRYMPGQYNIDDYLDVFLYMDSEDRPIATTEKPFAQVGEFALLKVVAVNSVGAFLDWGLPKDLLVPFHEQKVKMQEGKSYLVYIYLDPISRRIAASARLEKFLNKSIPDFENGQEVDLIIKNSTDLGYNAIINGSHSGLLYKNEVFQRLSTGQKLKGYVKKIRTDGKTDLCINKAGFEDPSDVADLILEKLKESNGFLALGDKTEPEKIYEMFAVSKRAFKAALGSLYKRRLIKIESSGIRLA